MIKSLRFIFLTLIITILSASDCGEAEEKKNDVIMVDNNKSKTEPNNLTKRDPESTVKYPFVNNPEPALSNIETLSFKCFFPGYESANRISFVADGSLTFDNFEGGESIGSWERTNDAFTVSIPEIQFLETTTSIAIDLDIVATLFFPSTVCGVLRVNDQVETSSEVLFLRYS